MQFLLSEFTSYNGSSIVSRMVELRVVWLKEDTPPVSLLTPPSLSLYYSMVHTLQKEARILSYHTGAKNDADSCIPNDTNNYER